MSFAIDLIATCSVLGIWPRFIEPRLLRTTHLEWPLGQEAAHLDGLKIVHLTDLHFHSKVSDKFLNKISNACRTLSPDLILFTGDFICYSQLESPHRLQRFLSSLKAPLGSFCSFGNHDYAAYVSRREDGVYDLRAPPSPMKGLLRGLKMLVNSPQGKMSVSDRVKQIPRHSELCALLAQTPFRLLENESIQLPCGLNLTGLGDLALGRCLPNEAFSSYDPHLPGIVLSHNPDSVPSLLSYPGNWILSGHTHGEQIHFPWPKWGRKLSRKLACLDNEMLTRGLFSIEKKHLYVNRGLGCHKPFRLFSPPEILCIRGVKK